MADRCQWDNGEEELLINILQEIATRGGRCDNGCFRSGTFDHIVSKMREKIPGININAKHVQNKIKRLKEKYSAAYDMLNTSGFGWDDARQCVTVDAPVLEEYLKKHPTKSYTANKPFPTYERLSLIFGKDRATGCAAESVADALENINLENEDNATEGMSVPLSSPSNGASVSSFPNAGETSTRKRKRKVAASDDLTKPIEKGLNSVSEEVHELVTAFKSSTPSLSSLSSLSQELQAMGLSTTQIVRASMYFAKNPNQLQLWNGMDASFKPEFVRAILEDDM